MSSTAGLSNPKEIYPRDMAHDSGGGEARATVFEGEKDRVDGMVQDGAKD
jgi:hypothetical protein